MQMETSTPPQVGMSIKQRLLARFVHAKAAVGPKWKDALSKSDPFFDTRTGEAFMRSVGQACSDPRRGDVDRIERVTVALEFIAGIPSQAIV
jgi:hypothetical protein